MRGEGRQKDYKVAYATQAGNDKFIRRYVVAYLRTGELGDWSRKRTYFIRHRSSARNYLSTDEAEARRDWRTGTNNK